MPPPPWRLVTAALSAGLIAVLGAGSYVAVTRSGRGAAPRTARSVHAAVAPDRLRGAQIEALLARRAAAFLRRNLAGYLATDDPLQPALRRHDARVFADAAGVPLASFSYTFDPAGELTPQPASLRRYRAPVYAPAVVYEHYQLAGFDPAPTEEPQYDTFVERAGHWYFASDSDFAAEGHPSTPDLWDLGPVRVVRLPDVLALGPPQQAGLLTEVADEAARDIPRVSAVWGPDWARRAVVYVPGSQAQLDELLGGDADLGQIAAVATAELPQGHARTAVGDRIMVNPATFSRLDALGRRVVITHELTHVASRADTGSALPEWLIEGFADYVGYLGTGVPVPVAATELAAQVRAGKLPAALPADAAFADADPQLPQVYEQAWLACRLIATSHGQLALVALYRQVGTAPSGSNPAATLQAALRDRLGTTLQAFTAAWRAYLVRELG